MKKTSLNIIETLGFDEKLLEKIKHFLGLTKEDEHCLQSLHDTVITWYEKISPMLSMNIFLPLKIPATF